MNRFAAELAARDLPLRRGVVRTLQVNVGKRCNLTCGHCHVNAGPKRKEIMTRETVDRIIDWLAGTDVGTVDLTGGAPEMIPDFRYLVRRVRELDRHVIDRCNLTILLEPGYEGTAEFLADQGVEIIASMPCYSPENVNAQRGDGVFDGSITALKKLNALGYGTRLPLNLVYNPNGDFLPGAQAELEADYKRELAAHFGITFHSLYTITNLPVSRFASWLKNNGKYEAYLELLIGAFNPATVGKLMCREMLNVDWQGGIYDCDFNQMLGLQLRNGRAWKLWDVRPEDLTGRAIATGDHCFGCTAGAGSSCGGALGSS